MKTVLVDLAHTFFIYEEGIFEEMHELLDKYPNRKILVTNAGGEKRKEKGMVDLPYEVFSLNNDPSKKESRYFEELLKHYNLNPEDVVYFDHVQECVDIASSIGIKSYYYNEEGKNLGRLEGFLNDNVN